MTVQTVVNAHVEPILRAPGYVAATPSLIGRWTASHTMVGDGSGGLMSAQTRFSLLDQPFVMGPYALISIEFYSYQRSASATYMNMDVNLLEYTANVVNLATRFSIGGAGTTSSLTYLAGLPKFKWRVIPAGAAYIDIYTDNVNGVSFTVQVGGYFWDERLL